MVTKKDLDNYAQYQREMWGNNLKCLSLWDWLKRKEKHQ